MNSQQKSTPLQRAIGLGSAKGGAGHWWIQRLSSVALIPLLLWLTASLISLAGSDYPSFTDWLGRPVTATLMVLLLIALFQHMALGLQVVIEDYVHYGPVKIVLVVLIQLGSFALATVGILAVLRIAFTAP